MLKVKNISAYCLSWQIRSCISPEDSGDNRWRHQLVSACSPQSHPQWDPGKHDEVEVGPCRTLRPCDLLARWCLWSDEGGVTTSPGKLVMLVLAAALAWLIGEPLSHRGGYSISPGCFHFGPCADHALCPAVNVESLKHCVARSGTSVSLRLRTWSRC